MRSNFITYANKNFLTNASALERNAHSVGFDDCKVLNSAELFPENFRKKHSKLIEAPRGHGYWLWKPYGIHKALQGMGTEDVLFYCDAGRSTYYQFRDFPRELVRLTRESMKGFLVGPSVPNFGPVSRWTKRDCLVAMGADKPEITMLPQVQATWSVWTKTDSAFSFLERWISNCCDPRCNGDSANTSGLPNLTDFEDHRHDQSILSILTYQTAAPYLNFDGTIIQKILNARPRSELASNFMKRPQNAEDMLRSSSPLILLREYLHLKSLHKK
jgi:hypothetical protein